MDRPAIDYPVSRRFTNAGEATVHMVRGLRMCPTPQPPRVQQAQELAQQHQTLLVVPPPLSSQQGARVDVWGLVQASCCLETPLAACSCTFSRSHRCDTCGSVRSDRGSAGKAV